MNSIYLHLLNSFLKEFYPVCTDCNQSVYLKSTTANGVLKVHFFFGKSIQLWFFLQYALPDNHHLGHNTCAKIFFQHFQLYTTYLRKIPFQLFILPQICKKYKD